MDKGYIEDWIKKQLGGKTPEEAGLSDEDLSKLLNCYENGLPPEKIHLNSTPACHCNICRT